MSMIERYRTAISHTLKTVNEVDMSKDPHLSSLLANFARVSDKQRTSVPPWDLALVLKRLTEAPFEPMHKADIHYIEDCVSGGFGIGQMSE